MRKAVILFNLGGPDKLENVEPFLFNLFNDPAILNLPKFFRYPLAKLIANRRAPTAKKIYEELGGSSPILKLTEEQASALELKLNKDDNLSEYKCFVVMRCWHPRAENVVKEVLNYNPNEVVLMPLYPQYSAATSGSSIKEWSDICKKNNVKTCSIVNVIESTIARNSDWVLPIHAGVEIGVASTKAFLGQLTVLYILCLKLAFVRKDINENTYIKNISNLKKLPEAINKCIKSESQVQLMAKEFISAKGSMFLGRGSSFPIALEGALKLKELSYLHAEGYPAGEMKHGPLALIEEGLPVIVIAPKDKYYEKTISNMQEVIARGGKILFITDNKKESLNENIRFGLRVPHVDNLLSPILLTLPLQMLAYHVALLKNCDVDKPRNLAKSVTVE